jgi:hypothetical protein
VAADATQRYKHIPELSEFVRNVLFVRPSYFLMVDSLASSTTHQYEWVAHFDSSVVVENGWLRGVSGNGQLMGVQILAPESFAIDTGDNGRPYAHVRPDTPVDTMRFVHLLYPSDEATWSERPAGEVTGDTGQALHVTVAYQDDTLPGHTDHILLTYTHAQTGTLPVHEVGGYAYDGKVAVVTQNGEGEISRIYFAGGTFLAEQLNERLLIENLAPESMIEITFEEETISVIGEGLSREFTLYAPNAVTLTVNGSERPFLREGDYITIPQEIAYIPAVLHHSAPPE